MADIHGTVQTSKKPNKAVDLMTQRKEMVSITARAVPQEME